jgi:hypothetical protein
MMHVFGKPGERAQAITIVAATFLAADVFARGLQPAEGNGEGARELRIGEAFALAKQFIAFAEGAGD